MLFSGDSNCSRSGRTAVYVICSVWIYVILVDILIKVFVFDKSVLIADFCCSFVVKMFASTLPK